MKTAAVIAEYNPFHKGHAWQLSQLRQRGASHIAVVMSPDFTQRGTQAILPKRCARQRPCREGQTLSSSCRSVTPVRGHRALRLGRCS